MKRLVFCSLLFSLTACKSSPQLNVNDYRLTVSPTPMTYTSTKTILTVESTLANPLYQQNEFIYKLPNDRFKQDFYNRFVTSAQTQIGHNTTQWLKKSGLFEHVAEADFGLPSQYHLRSKLIAIEADYTTPVAPRSHISLEYILLDNHNHILLEKKYSQFSVLSDKTSAALLKGWQENLGQILSSLTNDIAVAVTSQA